MYRVIILPKAIEDLSKIDKAIAHSITNKLTWLSENIENITHLPLKGIFLGFCKLTVGDWRVIYEINRDDKRLSPSIKIGHRRDIYR